MTEKETPKKAPEQHQTPIADYTFGRLQQEFQELGGLNDESIKRLTFFLVDQLGIDKFNLDIDVKSDPKRILIHVFDKTGRELGVKLKDASIFDKLNSWLGTEAYKIEFAHTGVSDEKESED